MTSTLAPAPAPPPSPLSGPAPASAGRGVARRAIRRWAWRLLRREWRQQLLVLLLIVVAVAATTVGLGLVANVQAVDQAQLGSATTRLDVGSPGSRVAADVASAHRALGRVDAIVHENVPVPGSVTRIDLRAQDPHGVYGAPMLRLVSGHYPSGAGQVAMTATAAAIFGLKAGDDWTADGRVMRVVGVVENPQDLSDEFALVAPGQIRTPSSLTLLTDAGESAVNAYHPPGGHVLGIMSTGGTLAQQQRNQALAVLLLATIGLVFIGLLAAAGYTVMAHRRQRALGMIGAIGATDRQVRRVILASGAAAGLVGATAGVVLGLAVWLGLRPAFEPLVGHRIDPLSMPWWAVIAGAVLAVVASVTASWWPARSAARLPIMAALSGRPAPPQPAHRFALLGGALTAVGFVLLVLAHGVHTTAIVIGIVATVAGVLLTAPLGIRALAAGAHRAPVAVRLALRDLARYQARSGSALAAAGLAIGIAATIAVTAAAQQGTDHNLSGGNLPTNQLAAWLSGDPNSVKDGGGAVAVAAPGQGASSLAGSVPIAGAHRTAEAIARSLGARPVVELDIAANPRTGVRPDEQQASLVQPFTDHGQHGWTYVTTPYVATPAVLALYGIPRSAVPPSAQIVTARTNLAGTQATPADGSNYRTVSVLVDRRLPNYTSAPNTLITDAATRALGFAPRAVGWLIQTSHPLTSAQISAARHRAAAAGIVIETRAAPDDSRQRLGEYATIIGFLLALGVLAMTVGLIRSETANDLRTLTATGASGRTRRTLTAATAASLALLGALLGTGGAYLALVAYHWRDLGYLSHPPVANLAALLVGLPVAALAGGWLLGRTPVSLARGPVE